MKAIFTTLLILISVVGFAQKKSLEQAKRSDHTIGLTDILSDIDTIEDVRNAGLI